MFKIILKLLWNKASKKQWQLELGSYLLKKGCGYQVGQIVDSKHLRGDLYRVRVLTGIFYDFNTNQINHTSEKRILKHEAGR